jgi:hypothetical protein
LSSNVIKEGILRRTGTIMSAVVVCTVDWADHLTFTKVPIPFLPLKRASLVQRSAVKKRRIPF